MVQMRAKMRLSNISSYTDENGNVVQENLTFNAVCKSTGYPADGSDEDNTFARFTPSASLAMSVCNPALLGTMSIGDTFYVDFTPAG